MRCACVVAAVLLCGCAGRAMAGAGYRAGSFAEFRITGWSEIQENNGENPLEQPPRDVSVRVGGTAPNAMRNDPNRADGDGAIRLPAHDKNGKVQIPAVGTAVAALSAAWGSSVCNTTGTSSDTATAWMDFTNNSRNRTFRVYYEVEWSVKAKAWGDDPAKDVSWAEATSSIKPTGFDAGLKPRLAQQHFPAQLGDDPESRSEGGGPLRPFFTIGPRGNIRVDLTTTAKGEARTTCTPAPGAAAVMVMGGMMGLRRKRARPE